MVKTDVGDDTQVGTDDVRAIQTPSQSYLDYGYIYLLFSKIIECHGGGKFEERGVKWFKERTMAFYEIDDIFLTDGSSVDADPFAEIYQVRGGVKTYFVTCRLKDGCQCV